MEVGVEFWRLKLCCVFPDFSSPSSWKTSAQNREKLTLPPPCPHWLNFPPLSERIHHKFRTFRSFCTKKCGRPHLKNLPFPLIRKMSSLDKPPSSLTFFMDGSLSEHYHRPYFVEKVTNLCNQTSTAHGVSTLKNACNNIFAQPWRYRRQYAWTANEKITIMEYHKIFIVSQKRTPSVKL